MGWEIPASLGAIFARHNKVTADIVYGRCRVWRFKLQQGIDNSSVANDLYRETAAALRLKIYAMKIK